MLPYSVINAIYAYYVRRGENFVKLMLPASSPKLDPPAKPPSTNEIPS